MSDFKNTGEENGFSNWSELYQWMAERKPIKFKNHQCGYHCNVRGLYPINFDKVELNELEKYTEPKKKRTFYLWADPKDGHTLVTYYDDKGINLGGRIKPKEYTKRLDFTATEFEVEG